MKTIKVGLSVAIISGIVILLFIFLWKVERIPSELREWATVTYSNLIHSNARDPEILDIIVFGHLYGSPSEDNGIPAVTITSRLTDLLNLSPDLFVSLGDMVYHNTNAEFEQLRSTIFNLLPVPLINTPGNHDVTKERILYNQYIRNGTYHSEVAGAASLIFLDTEIAECSLDEPQREFLSAELKKAQSDPDTQYILIFMHKTLVFQDPEMKAYKNKMASPNVWDCQKKDGRNPLMDEYFRPAAKIKPVVIFAGDVGAWGNLSPYYQRDPWLPLTLVMTGLGETVRDNVIRVRVSRDSIEIIPIFLEDMRVEDIRNYDRSFWIRTARGGDDNHSE